MSGSQDKNPFADPNYGKDLNSNGSGNPFSDPDYGKEEEKGFLGQAKDHAVSFLGKGTVGVGEVAVGLSNMMSDGATGKILSEKLGYDPKAAKNAMTGWQSEQYQQQLKDSANIGNLKIEEGDDFATKVGKKFDNAVDITKNAISNPSLITNTVAESLPSILLGGVLGRASGIANPVVAGSVGEAAVMAGSQAEQIRQETVDGRLTADQSLASVGTGALGGLFGYAGGRLAQKMGLSDVDTAMQTGRLTTQQVGEEIAKTPMRAIPTAVIKGAISEGFLEELPQSVSEQILQNLALDKPWHDGVENAAVMGTLAGMAMGGTVSGVGKAGDWWNSRSDTGPQDNQQQSGSPNLPSAPSQFGSNPDSALTGEYIPRGNVPQGDNQGRTAFVYDQPSMEADNLLNNNYKGDTGFDTSGNFGPSNNPDSPLSPSGGNYFDDPASQSQPQLPSERLGINPNDGPMSSAAALAVDSGASPIDQLGYTPEQQTQEQSNTPISDAVPSNYQSLLGSQNDGQPFDARFEDATVQQGNTQADNAGESISQQYDANAADAMGGGIETDTAQTTTAQTVQPILGQDGQNKWFGSQDKAQAFIDKKNLGNDYQVVQDGKRFEIQPKQVAQNDNLNNQNTTPDIENNIEKSQEIADLEQQFANEKSVPKKAQIRKQITELQNGLVSDQSQGDVPNPYDENNLRANVRHLSLQASKEAQAQNAEDSNYIADLGSTASARSNEKVKQQFPELYKRAEELAKTAEIRSAGRRGNTQFSSLSFKGDPSFVSGDSWTKRPTSDEILQQAIWHLSQDDKNSAPDDVPPNNELQNADIKNLADSTQETTPSNQQKDIEKFITENKSAFPVNWQRDGQWSEQARAAVEKKLDEILPSDVSYQDFQTQVDQAMEFAKKQYPTLEQQHEQNKHPVNKWQEEMNKALEKADPEHPLFKKLQASAKNGLRSASDQAVALRQAREIEKKVEVPKAKFRNEVTRNDLVSVTTTDGETHMVLASELNDSNVKNLTKFSAQGKRVAVKLPRGRIASTSEQSQQPKQAEQPKVEANEQRESKIQSWINEWSQLKENGTASELDNFHKKVKIALNGFAQKKGVVAEFEQLKVDIENFAKDYNKLPKTEQSTNTGPSAAETSTEQITAEIDSEATKTEATQKPKAEVSENRLVSDDRAAELRARLKAKLSQLNSGIDPEILAIGAELAVYHIERGARKFSAFAKNIANDLGVSVDKIRPYLRSWYNGARDMMEDMGADIQGMDSADTVRAELKKLDNPQQDFGENFTELLNGLTDEFGKKNVSIDADGKTITVKNKGISTDVTRENGSFSVFSMDEGLQMTGPTSVNDLQGVIAEIDKAIGGYGKYLQTKSEAKAKAAQEKAAAKEAEKQEVGDSVAYEPSSKSVEQQPIIHTEGKKKEVATTDVVKDSFDKAKAKQTKAEYDAMLKGFVADIEAAIKAAPDKPFSIEVPIIWKARTTSDGSPTIKDYVAAKDLMTLDNLADVIDSIEKTIKGNSASYLQERATSVISDAVKEYQTNYGNAPLRIVFDVKGDGRFNVRNDKQTLENFLKKVKNNSGFKPPVESKGGRETFNRVNAIRDMLKDSGDKYRTLNAYEMAKSMGYPIVYGDYGDYGIIARVVLDTFDYADHTFHTAVQLNDLEGNKKENIGTFSVVTEQGISITPANTQKEAKASLTKAVKPNEGDKIDRALRNHRSVRNMAEFRPQSELQQQFEAKLYSSLGLELPENQEDTANEQPTSNTSNPQGTSTVRGGRGRTSQSDAPQANNPNVETGVSTGSGTSNQNQSTGRSRIRDTGTDVANDGRVSGRGMESSRRKDASGTGQLPVDQPTRLESPAAVANTATDFYMADPELIIGGTQVKRFDKNKAALELLEELTSEGRQATTEEQAILAGYTGWGSFGQDLFQGTWDKPVFKDDSVWKERNLWLRERLGKESWESAKDSTINAHFTDPYTVAAMWAMAEKMGFTGGRVLEPAIGTGNFISLMPMHIKQRSQVTGIDLDITTAAIAKQLFPESNVQNIPYQKSKTPDNFYDLVISNVPFADIKIADRRYNQFNPNLHDYYFLKMLDQVRPGGIVMAITSSGTMDKQSEVIRRELAKKAELITSVRLPSGAFQEYAGTAVVTDIIVLRKRAEPLAMTPEVNWIGLSEVKTSSKPVKVNSFYAENLRNVLGTIDYGSGTTRFGAGMIVHRPHDLKQQLEKAANFVPEDALIPRHSKDHLTYYANKAGERTNTLTISNGELMFVYGDQMVKATDLFEYKIKDAKKTAQRQKSIEDLVAIRKAYTDLTDAERIEQDNVEQLRKTLNKLYQAYTKEHGPLADSFGLQYFRKLGDAYYYSLAALEVNGKPAEILKRSVVRGAAALDNPTVSDAFVVERNKSAAPSLANIAKMAQVSEDQARAELLEKGAVYVLPNGDIMPSDMYLSGNVRQKLEEAQNAVAEGNTDLQRNVDALKEIIPEDIPYFNIEAKMGATWVPLSDYEKYIAHMLGMTDSNGITVTFPSGKWKVKLDPIAARRTEATTNYGSKYKSFQTVVSAALSNQNITVKYKNADGSESVDVQATEEVNEKISKIKEDFATWLWSDPERRVQLEKEYNHAFNAWATPKYDGSFMSMQGMALSLGNGPFNLRQHQQNAIWRAIVNRRSINAHEVGTGKTFTMGGIALESRRYGIAKKPLILAHNANSAAVAKEIQMMYPSARVLFISELGKAVRQIRMRQIANDDWDVVVMPHSMIDKLTLSEETLMAMAADDIAALEAELEEALAEEGGATLDEVLAMDSETVNKKMGFKNPTAKQLAKQRLKLLEDIQKQAMDSSKADAVNFEELGVDMIMVDEVHEFKKPSIATRMNMKGLNTSSNKRSVNLQLLTRYVRRMNNGGNVHTFTGTPITNTLTEIYHQMRYVMEEEMQKLNVAAWDGWFGSFATDITDIELSATGEYQLVTRLAGFVNVPELRKMIGQFMDIVFANDMPEMQPRKTKTGKVLSDEGLTEAEKAELLNGRTEGAKDRPYKKVINVTTEMSPKQEQTLAEIQSLAKEWERASGKEKRKWMRDGDPRAPLSISTAAKKASYDARIGDPEYVGKEGQTEDFEMSKASQVVKNVMEVYHSHPLASQVIFADTGYNTTTERSTGQKDDKGKTIRERVKVFSPIKDIVERLVQSGIPREQIAIVDGSVKAEARKAIADKVNTGEIRVVIGLTQTLGVGVNMQRNLRAMHHLDAPWMPGELEQRNGRGLRQGNQWNTVLEYRYITDKLDGKSWQVLAIKDRFINAFMKADVNVRSIEGDAAADNGEDNAGDIMSSFSEASGDPRVLQRIKMKEKLEKLQRKERLHTQGIADMKRTIGNTQRRIARFDEQIAEYENNAVLDRIQKLMQSQSENFSAEVDGKKYDKHKEASDAIQQFIADHVRTGSSRITLGKYGNVTMSVEWDSLQPQATLSMKIGPIEFKGNTLRGIEGKLRGVSQDIQAIEDAKASAQQTIDSLSKAVEQPFGQADQLTRTQKQLENIEQDLEINPVAPPIWLRRGAPIDSEVYYKGKLFIVSGHRYTNDGWFVSADDAKGTIEIPYLEATDSVGMPIYEERVFEAPNINDKTKADNDVKNEINDYSRDKLKPDNERRGTSPLSTSFLPLSKNRADRLVVDILSRISKGDTPNKSKSGISGIVQPKFPFVVVESFEALPKTIQQENYYQGEQGETKRYDVMAVWHKGTLYINAGDIRGNHNTQQTTYEAYEEVLIHEVVGHFGVQQLFGQEYKTKFQQLFNALGGIEGIRKIAKDNGVDMNQFDNAYIKPFKKGVEEGYYDPLDAQQATVSELFAFVAQNAKSRPFVRQKLKEVIGYIRQWFRDRGFDKFLSRYNDADLMMFLSEARKAVVDRSYFGKYKNQEFSSKNNSDTPLYSRRTKSNSGSTTQQVRDVLIDRFGKETIDELERQGKLEIIQDYQVEGVEGFYYSGKAVLVASNLTAESTVPTFLHELGGHAGFQNMMTQKQYNELMNQFNKLVDQGNPVAMAAKLLAEREQGSERQHLEYLPYLLTLSSTMQQRNVVQRNALQKLINNLVTYVKATLFDNFGINLNLNPNDIVALAERMIEKSSYNAENATSPLYSRQFSNNVINNLSESIKNLSAKSIKDKAGYKWTDWLGVGLSALGRRQLTEIYSKLLPQLNKYNDLAAQMDADKNDAGAEADNIVREWSNLRDEDQLAEVMHDSTLAKIDPSKPYVSGDSISKYKQLRDAYNSLSPEAQAMYVKARDAYKKHYANVHQAIKERILRSELSNQKKADLLKQMDDNFFGSIKGVYFPLARFGKYVVVMRNQNGEVESVSRAETMGEAQALRSELIQKFPHYKVNKVKLDKEYNKSRDAVGRGFMTSLFAEVDNLGLSTAERTEFEDTLSQLYLSSMPDLSWAKHGIHRKGTAGFSQDARRAFAQNMFSGANYLAKLRYGDQLAQQLDEMQKYADEQFEVDEDYDQRSAQSVITEMNKRHDNLMNPKGHPLSSALTSLGFIYYLGLSPAAAIVNLSQTALVAYPLMGAKWGFDKAADELLKASNDFRKGVEFHKVKWEGSKTDLYKTISSDISKFLNKDEKQAYEDAVARGVIDVTQAHDLAGIAQGEDSGVMWKTRPIMRAASVMFHSAERFNREVTFIAAYRLARQSDENHDSAFDQAVDATYRGHSDYSSGNRPRIMQGNVAKVLLLFKQFGQNMVYTLARQTYQSIKGETKEERREARRAISAILAMHATFAGALGLPMVGMLLSVASWMGGDDDEPWDAEVALRNYLAEAFNPTISNMLMKGAPRGIGVDISSRVGINNLLLPDIQEGLEGKKWWDSAASAALGPIGGIGANVAKGAQEISEGHNLRGVESMLPVFLKNFAKTYRYADEGVQDKTGISIMDEVDSMDLLVQGMGFSPSDVRTANEGKTAIYQLNRKLNERRSRLMTLWSRAKMMDDQQEMDEIWGEIQGFNDKNPSRRITRMNLNQSYRNRQRRIDRAEDGIYLPRNHQDAREVGKFADTD